MIIVVVSSSIDCSIQQFPKYFRIHTDTQIQMNELMIRSLQKMFAELYEDVHYKSPARNSKIYKALS